MTKQIKNRTLGKRHAKPGHRGHLPLPSLGRFPSVFFCGEVMGKIKGGYYLKAKCVQESWVAKAPPHIREIWDLFLMKALYKDGDTLKRGQLVTTYSDIIEDLSWFVGYRKMTYKRHHCETAMKALRKAAMITTTKTTRGMVVTVLNYSKYQNIKNYETYTRPTEKPTRDLQPTATIEKEVKEVKEVKNTLGEYSPRFEEFWKEYPNKKGKYKAHAAWKKYKCDNGQFESIMKSLQAHKKSDGWIKDNGQFIPHGSTWVNGRGWEDEAEITEHKPKSRYTPHEIPNV